MNLHDLHSRYKRLDDLIRRKATGTLNELATKFDSNRRSMSRHLEEFKQECDAPVAYDRSLMTYYYTEPFDLKIVAERTRNGEKKII